jgi:hypothetical protein
MVTRGLLRVYHSSQMGLAVFGRVHKSEKQSPIAAEVAGIS